MLVRLFIKTHFILKVLLFRGGSLYNYIDSKVWSLSISSFTFPLYIKCTVKFSLPSRIFPSVFLRFVLGKTGAKRQQYHSVIIRIVMARSYCVAPGISGCTPVVGYISLWLRSAVWIYKKPGGGMVRARFPGNWFSQSATGILPCRWLQLPASNNKKNNSVLAGIIIWISIVIHRVWNSFGEGARGVVATIWAGVQKFTNFYNLLTTYMVEMITSLFHIEF